MKEHIYQTEITEEIPSRLPGYFLIECNADDERTTAILMEGITRFFAGFGENTHIFDIGKYKFALLLPELLPKMNCVSFIKDNDDFAFMEGTFYDYELLKKNKSQLVSTDLAKEVLEIVKNEQFEKLKLYNGRYSGFVYLKNYDKLVLITDSYGANRVFVYEKSHDFIVSNNVFSISTNPFLSISVNEESIAQIIHYEYPAYRHTEFNEIKLVLPSDILVRQGGNNNYLKAYQKVNRTPEKSNKEYIDELRSAIDLFFKETINYLQEPMGIYLSKGKDSRLFLPFLERNVIPYQPFVFKMDTGIFDYPQVKKIASLLGKDLHVLEEFKIKKHLSFLTSMNTTPTISWLALGKVAGQHVSNALMGLYGECSSGKLSAHRNYGIVDRESSIKATILGNSRGISSEEANKWVPYYKKWDTELAYRNIYNEFPPVQIPFDYDTYQDIDHRSFRNSVVILMKAQHFITPIAPFMDKRVADVYHRLPLSLLKSQIAHTVIASEEPKSNKVQSTAFPVSLKNERYIRPLLVEIVKLNNKYRDVLLSAYKRNYKPYVKTDTFIPRSEYFQEVLSSNKELQVGNPRILTRLYHIDDYLQMTFKEDLTPYYKKPSIVQNDLVPSGKIKSIPIL